MFALLWSINLWDYFLCPEAPKQVYTVEMRYTL